MAMVSQAAWLQLRPVLCRAAENAVCSSRSAGSAATVPPRAGRLAVMARDQIGRDLMIIRTFQWMCAAWPSLVFSGSLPLLEPAGAAMAQPYQTDQPERSAVDALPGITALDFGTDWCGFCKGAAPHIQGAIDAVTGVRHLKVEDGPGRKLGRSFRSSCGRPWWC